MKIIIRILIYLNITILLKLLYLESNQDNNIRNTNYLNNLNNEYINVNVDDKQLNNSAN